MSKRKPGRFNPPTPVKSHLSPQQANVTKTGLKSELEAEQWVRKANQMVSQGDYGPAIRALTEALKLEPVHLGALQLQAALLERFEKPETAQKLLELVVLQAPPDPQPYLHYARMLARSGNVKGAIAALKRALQLQPNRAEIRRQLAGLYGTLGRTEQRNYWAEKSAAMAHIELSEATQDSRLTILALSTSVAGDLKMDWKKFTVHSTQGHNNLLGGLDRRHITLIGLQVDTLKTRPDLLNKLPAADLIYNSITDAERAADALRQAESVVEKLKLPVINSPAAILETDRLGTTRTLADSPGLLLPRIILLKNVQDAVARTIRKAAVDNGLKAPIIVRAPGFNGPQFTQLVSDLDALEDKQVAPGDLYLIQHHQVWFTDDRIPGKKIYPKYRAVLVGDELYPVHLRFALDHYNVHRAVSNKVMAEHPWLNERCQQYLDDPASHFAPGRWEELRQALIRQRLDFTGADFAASTETQDDGKLVIFEANAAMRSWLTDLPEGDPVQKAWQKVLMAAHEHFCETADVEPWAFELPKGKAVESANATNGVSPV